MDSGERALSGTRRPESGHGGALRRDERAHRGTLRREVGVGALLAGMTVLAMAAGGSFQAAPAGATAGDRAGLVLQCPLGVHRVALPSSTPGR